MNSEPAQKNTALWVTVIVEAITVVAVGAYNNITAALAASIE